ncbi:MAG: hypothetical protein PHE84_05285 [bacterium]|nr:hypothetical protein [bacterium]
MSPAIKNIRFSLVRAAAPILLMTISFWACGAEEKSVPASGPCLSLTDLFTFTDSDYRFHVTGKVKNFSPENADGVVVTADLFSDPDHQIPISSGSQSLPPIPGQEGFRTFDIWSPAIRLLPGTAGFPAVFFETLLQGTAAGNEPIPVPELKLDDAGIQTDVYGRYHIQAKITNVGPVTVEMVYLTAFFFRDEAQTGLIARLRKGFGRFLKTPDPTADNPNPGSPVYLVDLWHPEINQDKYPTIFYRLELSQ